VVQVIRRHHRNSRDYIITLKTLNALSVSHVNL
jgi:hypothetical protein